MSNPTRVVDMQARTTRVSLELPKRLNLEEWQRIGDKIFRVADSSKWWLGDWLVYGQDRYPERYRQAIEETSLDYKTLRNYAWVARRFPEGARREALSLQHHAEVAGLELRERILWLTRAEQGRWSRNELRRRVSAERNGLTDRLRAEGPLRLKATDGQIKRWGNAAQRAECELEGWILKVLDAASDVEVPWEQTRAGSSNAA